MKLVSKGNKLGFKSIFVTGNLVCLWFSAIQNQIKIVELQTNVETLTGVSMQRVEQLKNFLSEGQVVVHDRLLVHR